MADRSSLIQAFLARCGWALAARAPLAGDASARRYDRLVLADGSRAVLMDADPARGQDVTAFVRIAGWLHESGLSAPRIYGADPANGLLLLEDFGDAVFFRLVAAKPDCEIVLYEAAVDVLLALRQQAPPPDLAAFTPQVLAEMITPVFDWYARPLGSIPTEARKDRIQAVLETVLDDLDRVDPVFCLRDCHAENMIWLPDRGSVRRVGLLDFQDAVIAHPAYDLVSLLQDARRDVSDEAAKAALRRYADATGMSLHDLRRACHAQGIPRHLRILGIFARLSLRDGKPGYVDLIPRVWRQLLTCLSEPGMEHLSNLLKEALPTPNVAALETLKTHAA